MMYCRRHFNGESYRNSFRAFLSEVGDFLTLQRGSGPPMWLYLSHLTVMAFNVYLNNLRAIKILRIILASAIVLLLSQISEHNTAWLLFC